MSVSLTIIAGRLTKDVDLRTTQNGKPVCSFTVAVDTGYGDRKTTTFYDCVAWNKTAEFVHSYFRKGSFAIVTGKMQTRKWQDKQGNNRISWELLADTVDFGGEKRDKLDDVASAARSAGIGGYSGVDIPYEEVSGDLPF